MRSWVLARMLPICIERIWRSSHMLRQPNAKQIENGKTILSNGLLVACRYCPTGNSARWLRLGNYATHKKVFNQYSFLFIQQLHEKTWHLVSSPKLPRFMAIALSRMLPCWTRRGFIEKCATRVTSSCELWVARWFDVSFVDQVEYLVGYCWRTHIGYMYVLEQHAVH